MGQPPPFCNTSFLFPDLDPHISVFQEILPDSHSRLVLPQHKGGHSLHPFIAECDWSFPHVMLLWAGVLLCKACVAWCLQGGKQNSGVRVVLRPHKPHYLSLFLGLGARLWPLLCAGSVCHSWGFTSWPRITGLEPCAQLRFSIPQCLSTGRRVGWWRHFVL